MSSSTSSSDPTGGALLSRPLPRALAFGLLVGAVLTLLGQGLERVMRELDPNLTKIEEMMAFDGEAFDVLYLGDSLTLEGVNPAVVDAELGVRSYNLATGGQSLLESELILRNFLARNPKPRLLMLGVYVNVEHHSAWMNPSIYFDLSKPNRALYARRAQQDGARLPRSYPVFNRVKAYRFRRAIEHLLKYTIQGHDRRPRFEQGHLALSAHSIPSLGPTHEVGDEHAALDDLLAYCHEQGLPVLLFEPPNHPGYSLRCNGRADKLARLEGLAARDPDVRFRSFNDESSLDYGADEWVNLNHLNGAGARRFTREQIVPYLRGHLPPRSAAGPTGEASARAAPRSDPPCGASPEVASVR